MATILAISSQVVRGHVGLSASKNVLERLGHTVWALPTILLSNHPGHRLSAAMEIDPPLAQTLFETLDKNGWLDEIDAVLTGYLPSADHVGFAANVVQQIRTQRKDLIYLCDPILGDDPKGLYLNRMSAEAIAEKLVPLADILTPNSFELRWLINRLDPDCAPENNQFTYAALRAALNTLPVHTVLATGLETPPLPDQGVDISYDVQGSRINMLKEAERFSSTQITWRPTAPQGTGDMIAALFLGHILNGENKRRSLALATAGVEAALAASIGSDELRLAISAPSWSAPEPWPTQVH